MTATVGRRHKQLTATNVTHIVRNTCLLPLQLRWKQSCHQAGSYQLPAYWRLSQLCQSPHLHCIQSWYGPVLSCQYRGQCTVTESHVAKLSVVSIQTYATHARKRKVRKKRNKSKKSTQAKNKNTMRHNGWTNKHTILKFSKCCS